MSGCKEEACAIAYCELSEWQKQLISKVFQNYYCMGLAEIAEEDEDIKELFKKLRII